MTATITTNFAHGLMGFRITAGAGENLGSGIKLVDDFNGDGLADIIMSGPLQDTTDTVVVYGDAAFGAGDQVNLAGLAAADGFRIDLNGNGNVNSGLGTGDVNGDGLSDLILTNDSNGDAFALFGNANLVYGSLSMATLDGADGFEIVDSANVESFQLGEANGDFNGDGFDDIVVSTGSSPELRSVIFGGDTFGAGFDVDELDGSDGFQITSQAPGADFGDFVGDFNGDGFDDMLFWERGIGNGDGTVGAGAVLFGGNSLAASNSIDDLDDEGVGLRLKGENNQQDRTAVGVGDINGDGLGDIFIADAPVQADGGGVVIFGREDSGITIDFAALDGSNGFRVVPPAGQNLNVADFNNVAAAGDFNGDGIDDFVIGARAVSTISSSGQVYVIFGQTSGFAADLDVEALGFDEGIKVVNDEGGTFGVTVSGGADVNGDGFDDIAIGGGINAAGLEEQTILLGRDFAGGAQVGGDGADTFTGDGHTKDRFFGGAGDDILDGGGDTDVLSGGAGDDILIIGSGNFIRVDGGSGNDILRIPGSAGITLDFTETGHEGIHSIETIDLCGGSGNFLRIRPVDVAGLSETTNKLFVTGGPADAVTLIGQSLFPSDGDAETFVFAGVETVGGVTFDRYEAGARVISVQQGVVVSREVAIGDLAGESIRMLDVDGDFDGDPAAFGLGTTGTLGADLNGDGVSDVLIAGPGPVGGQGLILDIRSEELPASGDFDVSGQDDLNLSETGQTISSVGDINGDGFDDFVQVQAVENSLDGYASIEFGNAGTGGTAEYDSFYGESGTAGRLGTDVSGGGDFNGDGLADMIVSAPFLDGAAGADSGRAYIIYGQSAVAGSFPAIDPAALDGADGVVLDGPTAAVRFGQGVESLGDINGDGLDDMAIAAPFLNNNGSLSGSVFVIFGQVGGIGAAFDVSTINGNNGFRIDGDSQIPTHRLSSVRDAGDINNDGIDDILVSGFQGGSRHIVFGARIPFPVLQLNNLDGSDGFEVSGFASANDGDSTGLGDFNGDGIDDLMLGDSTGSTNGLTNNGRAVILHGSKDAFDANIDSSLLSEDQGLVIHGDRDNLNFGVGGRQGGDVNNDGFADLLIGAPGGGNVTDGGESHLIFGDGDALFRDGLAGETLSGNGQDNIILGDGGDDILRGGNGEDSLKGGIGDDILLGQADNDILIGGAGVDRLNGGTGEDVMRGGAGNDIYTVDNVDDVVIERFGEGTDRINTTVSMTNPGNVEFLVVASTSQGLILNGSVFRDQITGANKISIGDEIDGKEGNDLIVGKVGNDQLSGGEGNDRLFGNSGNDTFNGGLGNDVMTGQQGIDTYVFDMQPGRDTITDFTTGEDILDVSGFFQNLAEVQAVTEDVNGNAQITFGPGGNFLTLIGVTEAQLSSSDFVFSPPAM